MKEIFRLIKEYKLPLIFLGKFLGLYMVLNLLYGLYIESFTNNPDRITELVSNQSCSLLRMSGFEVNTFRYPQDPKVALLNKGKTVINVFEGCNGINVMIIFVSFIIAFKGTLKNSILYILVGLIIIHLANLIRITFLFLVSEYFERYLYFTHKYIFTAAIYGVVFLLWIVWVRKYSLY